MDVSPREVGFKLYLMSSQAKDSERKKAGFEVNFSSFLKIKGSQKLWFTDLMDQMKLENHFPGK